MPANGPVVPLPALQALYRVFSADVDEWSKQHGVTDEALRLGTFYGLISVRSGSKIGRVEITPRGKEYVEYERMKLHLESIASAQSLGSMEQSEWMIRTAKEGLGRA